MPACVGSEEVWVAILVVALMGIGIVQCIYVEIGISYCFYDNIVHGI
jgi:hypothetical protein